MARFTNAMVTFDDLIYMDTNEDFISLQSITSSNRCPTKTEIVANLYVYENYILGYADNQLVAYDDLKHGVKKITLLDGDLDKDIAYNNTTVYGDYWFKTLTTYPNIGDIIYAGDVDAPTYTRTNNTNEIFYHRIQNSDIIIAIDPNDGSVIDRKDMSQTLSVSPTTVSTDSSSGSSTISVTSNSNWEVLESVSWLSVSATSGSGNGSFSVSFTENTGNSRNGTFTVRNPDGANSIQVTVSQDSATATYQYDVAYDVSSTSNACSFTRNLTRYTNNSSFTSSTELYSDSSGTFETTAGYYSDHSGWIYWDPRTNEVTSSGLCGGI